MVDGAIRLRRRAQALGKSKGSAKPVDGLGDILYSPVWGRRDQGEQERLAIIGDLFAADLDHVEFTRLNAL